MMRVILISAITFFASSVGAEVRDLEFRSWPSQDTVYEYQPIYLFLAACNRTDTTIAVTPLEVTDPFITMRIADHTGTELPLQHVVTTWLPVDPPQLLGGDSLIVAVSINHNFTFRQEDDISYLPAGDYLVRLYWRYDPWGRKTVEGTGVLSDSFPLTVIPAEGPERAAQQAYLSVKQQRMLRDLRNADYWDVYETFPQSPFGEAALYEIMIAVRGRPWTSPKGMSRLDVARTYLSSYPDHPRAAYMVKELTRWDEIANVADVLREIHDTVPNTAAGMKAKELLDEME